MAENDNVWVLTPEEQALVDELSNQRDTGKTFEKDDNHQRRLLSGLLQDRTLSESIGLVDKRHWSAEAHVIAFGCLKQFWTQYKELPSRFILMELFLDQLKERKAEIVLHYRAEIESIYDYYTPGVVESKYMIDELKKWVRVQSIRLSVHALQIEDEKKPFDQRVRTFKNELEDIASRTSAGDIFETWDETLANQEKEDWLIPNWLEFGSLGMLAGDPFSGKSHLLAGICGAIFKGNIFARYVIPSCAVVLVDAENKRRIFVKRISNAMQSNGDDSAIRKLYRRIDTARLKLPLSVDTAPETIRDIIRRAKRSTGQERVFVIIDTMRSVCGADEMEVADMVKLLYPLQRVAMEENAAILILHHRPKSGATYSGQTSIAGACDYLWLWESDIATGFATLKLAGTRGDHEPDIKFALRNGRNEWIPDGADEKAEAENRFVGTVESALKSGPLSQSDTVKAIRNLWPGNDCPGEKKMIAMLNALEGSVVIVKKGINNASIYSLISVSQPSENQ